jgi:hypothetical protein
MKKFLTQILHVVLIISILGIPNVFAAASPHDLAQGGDTPAQEYISFEEYLEKYGQENVIAGFERAEAEALGHDTQLINVSEGKSLYECLSEGRFLGFEVLGISDVAPDDPNMVIHLDTGDVQISPSVAEGVETLAVDTKSVIHSGDSIYYYSDTKPDPAAMDVYVYEPNSGSYFYKYSYSFGGYYQCDTTLTFKNTTLYCGTQTCCSYIFLNAKSNIASIDFGLMANPADSYRNQGLYAFWTPSPGKLDVEAYPKVSATFYSAASKLMILENKSITIKLGVGTDQAIMAMESGGSNIFYKVYDLPGLTSLNSSKPLTFLQAMSCIAENADYTIPNSGTYLRNVQFSNTTLYDLNGARPFTTIGPYTYFTYVCKPDNISYTYDNAENTEYVSIVYDSSEPAAEESLAETGGDISDLSPAAAADQQLPDLRAYIADLEGLGAALEEHPSPLGTLAIYRTPHPRTGAQYNADFYRNDGKSFSLSSLLPPCWHPYFHPRDIRFSEDGTLLTFISPIEEPIDPYRVKQWGDILCTVDLTTGEMLSMEPVDL